LRLTVSLSNLATHELEQLHHDRLTVLDAENVSPADQYSRSLSIERCQIRPDWEGDIERLIRLFAIGLDQGVFLSDPFNIILNEVRSGWRPRTGNSFYEVAWMLFSKKDWVAIINLLGSRPAAALSLNLRSHLADLYFLAVYRKQKEIILDGVDLHAMTQAFDRATVHVRNTFDPEPERLRFYQALLMHIRGDFSEARKVFVSTQETTRTQAAFRAIGSILPEVPEDLSGSSPTDISALTIHPRNGGGGVFLIAADRTYFDRYFGLFVRSLRSADDRLPLHLHCIGFDPQEDLTRMGVLEQIGYTVDNTDLSAFSEERKRAYYASARFLYADHYLGIYSGLYICDIDGVISGRLEDVISETAAYDVILTKRLLDPHRRVFRLPWEAIAAGNLGINATAGGIRFAGALAKYLSRIFCANHLLKGNAWYCDQNALFYSWLSLKSEVRFSPLPRSLFSQSGDWSIAPGSDSKLAYMLERTDRI